MNLLDKCKFGRKQDKWIFQSLRNSCFMISIPFLMNGWAMAQTTATTPAGAAPSTHTVSVSAAPKAMAHFYIEEYRVKGNGHLISQEDFENAVYPFLGPYRTSDDVEQARAALENVYHDKGYRTVGVEIPPQQMRGGVVMLQVVQNPIGRLRVTGSRYFSLDEIKREAPSLSEGTVPNFNQVTKDVVALNQSPDRRITPSLQAGLLPGTVDVDLGVKDTVPLHGSLELNNRYSADTSPLRVNGSVSYDNLWQLEHSVGFSFQLAPEDLNQVQVFSGYYLAHIPGVEGVSLMLQGTDQDSNVSTLGGIGVAGKGDTLGLRAIFTLPSGPDFYESLSLGFDYKHYEQDLTTAGTVSATPITYYPFSASYSSTQNGKIAVTQFNAGVTFGTREIGSDPAEFTLNRQGASGNFIYFRGDLSQTQNLPEGFQTFEKIQGQAASQPLITNEQFSGGGIGTVRGYLESEVLGDNGVLGSIEARTPSLGNFFGKDVDEWRFYAFGEGGILALDDPLPEQKSVFNLASAGVGTTLRTFDHFNGSLDVGVPLLPGPNTARYSPLFTFRVWFEF
jgi:hemolysin activation/secretion protein